MIGREIPSIHTSLGVGIDYYYFGKMLTKDKVDFNYLGNSKVTKETEKYRFIFFVRIDGIPMLNKILSFF